MKRGGPLQRRTPLTVDPAKTAGWQQRSRQAAAARQREQPRAPLPQRAEKPKSYGRKKPRNDSDWRAEVMALRGPACRSCGGVKHVQADHLIPRSQGGPSVVENGLPLCGEFGEQQCHVRKTAHTLQIEKSWLDDDQVEWLRASGNAWWEEDGTVAGRHCRLFAPVQVGGRGDGSESRA